MLKSHSKTGFTLVELSLAIVFVSALSLTLVAITLNLTSTYRRGLVLKQVNTTGSSLTDDIRAAIAESSAKNILDLCDSNYKKSIEKNNCVQDGAYSFVYLVNKANVIIGKNTPKEKKVENVPVYGAFCTGTYSYIWNSGYYFDKNEYEVSAPKAIFSYLAEDGKKVDKDDFRLLKINDPSRLVCVSKVNNVTNFNTTIKEDGLEYTTNYFAKDNTDKNKFVMRENPSEEPIDLLVSNDNKTGMGLALYDLAIYRPVQDSTTRNIFYSGSFILATIMGGIDIKSTNNYCATPAEAAIEYFDYCAINKFNFAIRAGGE